MDVIMRINRVSTHPVEVDVHYAGEAARATLPELEVEMYDEGQLHGTTTLHFRTQADIAEARKTFKQGGEIVASYSAKPAAPEVISTDALPAA